MALVVVTVGIVAFVYLRTEPEPVVQVVQLTDPKNIEYTVEGQKVKLTNGVAETEAAPGSASKIITKYFGNELSIDLNDDGKNDTVFILVQDKGGSGVFYYVAAALAGDTGHTGSEAIFIGDRIAPQNIEKSEGSQIIVNYADRNPGEDFTIPPSVGKSLVLLFDPATLQFGQVVQDFEGEADPSAMTLGMQTWRWTEALYNDGREVVPPEGVFTLKFEDDGTFTTTTDCNSVGGTYVAEGSQLSFPEIMSTKMFCEQSQEVVFVTLLRDTAGYHFTSKGELILDLKFDSGSVIFR